MIILTDFPQNFIKSNTGVRSQESPSQESGGRSHRVRSHRVRSHRVRSHRVRRKKEGGRRKEEGGRRKSGSQEVRKSGRRTILLCFIPIDFILL
ncbi:MAG: hypothetical protein JHC73_07650 [Dolichospermum sp.]|nr:hypothetical protein [Dolichospermum sp.]